MNRRVLLMTVLVLALALLLVACGGGAPAAPAASDAPPVGDAARGKELYEQVTIGSASAPGCVTCHSLEPDTVLVGPSHAGLSGRAGSYVEGKTAEAYLRESIMEPDAHVVDGFSPGLMYQNYAEELQARDVNDLVAFLLTLN